MGFGDGLAGPCMASVHGWCMASVSDIGVLDLGIGVGFWMRYVVTSLLGGCPLKRKFFLSAWFLHCCGWACDHSDARRGPMTEEPDHL